jgi:hypothetical protein
VTMKKVIWGAVIVLAYFLVVIGLEYLWYRFSLGSYLFWGTEIIILVAVNLIFLAVFLLYRYKTREHRLAEEANGYLVRRKRERDESKPARTSTRRRWVVWVPCIFVAAASLFVPEEMGIAFHLILNRRAVLDNKYRIRIPATWAIGYSNENAISIVTAPGMGRIGFRTYWRDEVPVAEIAFYVVHPQEQWKKGVALDNATILARHSFAFGNESLNCWDLIHHGIETSYPTDASIAEIRCSSDSEYFYADFIGWRGDSGAFYRTLERITILK